MKTSPVVTLSNSILKKYKANCIKLLINHSKDLDFGEKSYQLVVDAIQQSIDLGIRYGRLAEVTEQVFNVKSNPN